MEFFLRLKIHKIDKFDPGFYTENRNFIGKPRNIYPCNVMVKPFILPDMGGIKQ